MEYFSLNIKVLRERFGKRQNEVESDLGFKSGVISNYERGKSMPSVENLYRISNYFRISIDDILKKDLSKEAKSIIEPEQTHTKTVAPQSNILRIIEVEWEDVKQQVEDLQKRMRKMEESG